MLNLNSELFSMPPRFEVNIQINLILRNIWWRRRDCSFIHLVTIPVSCIIIKLKKLQNKSV